MPPFTNASYVGRFAPPGRPETTSTPSAFKHSINASTARMSSPPFLHIGEKRQCTSGFVAAYEEPMPTPIASTIAPPTVTTSSDERIDTSRKRFLTQAIANSSNATTQPATSSALLTSEMRNGSGGKKPPG